MGAIARRPGRRRSERWISIAFVPGSRKISTRPGRSDGLTTVLVPSFDIWAYVDQIRSVVSSNDPALCPSLTGMYSTTFRLRPFEAVTGGGSANRSSFMQLRASSVAFMNDSQEYIFGKNLIISGTYCGASRCGRLAAGGANRN